MATACSWAHRRAHTVVVALSDANDGGDRSVGHQQRMHAVRLRLCPEFYGRTSWPRSMPQCMRGIFPSRPYSWEARRS